MIALKKSPVPDWVEQNQYAKTAEYAQAPEGKKPTPWRAKEIVEGLKLETAGKCIYCEAFIDDVSYSAVEHIKPKSLFEDLVLEWSNLGLVCVRCNTNKKDYWTEDSSLQLLDPYIDDVEVHLAFEGPLTVARVGSSRGENTVRKLKFSKRADLLISRAARMEYLYALLKIWEGAAHDSEEKELYAEDVRTAIGNDAEFAGVLRQYASRSGFPVEPG